MSSQTEAAPVQEALEIIDSAEKRASLSTAEARALRRTITAATLTGAPWREKAAIGQPLSSPGFERTFAIYSEGIVYGMGTGLVAGLLAVLVTGSQMILGAGMFGGMAIGVGIVAGREARGRSHTG
ncbi:hypothetical protein [Longimicrobium terrae]|uniref:Uncharacterized protein n=1 Tax=Longimicrobium terrae TaxID=1639882 RepID=A0A841GW74_9BACT|nr:hypothetical protein [Longimicrobium terrae]MBB4635580.1 hypothetical protein [Longimicrobium terrae]MBB6069974.1 hypothetical protein [Longimicrobium terrae]NNC32885.1 hypothetical protein [Longimicrobium terrae]